MMKRKGFYVFILMMAIMLVLSACGEESTKTGEDSGDKKEVEGQTYKFKLAHIAPPDHIWNDAAKKFSEELETRSDGRMTMELYPGGQLGGEPDMVQQLETGTLDFGFITTAFLTSRSDAFSAWFAPFLFDSYETAFEAKDSDISKRILATLDDQGLRALDIFFSGHRTMMFREKVETPEEMKGLTLRVTPSPALQDWYRYLGANPESISLPDVYQAAQTGVIDGMEMDLDAAVTSNFNEVTGYAAMTNHMVWPSVMIANGKKFDAMPEEDQKIIREAMAAASEYATLKRSSLEEEYVKTLTDRGMVLYEMDESLFKPYMEKFDEEYKIKDPLIKEFIETFRK
ncbi:TRAP transporter substrate-binding protein [Sporosarcina sp. ANT_H38]|uniref:TRAP transporter substrate-binding protein n=1 Tax=Sporosarcina sp. ANT_H38 TaxID=2597358 RepID=UPI0011F3FFEF|nr:TRAP transporter substrate-binding protein [Sporosarcina sp. ANT_H38]KAA0966287.1 TRAP transporter substrate-binding protein [Sporosarcina sp. ANT_H38]